MILRKLCLALFFLFFGAFLVFSQEKSIPREGEGIYAFLRRNNRSGNEYYDAFLQLNKGKLGKNNSLIQGVSYLLPPVPEQTTDIVTTDYEPNIETNVEPDIETNVESDIKTSAETSVETNVNSGLHKQVLFGKKYESYAIKDHALAGACFFLVSGHGGPDCGAIAKVDGKELHEDEYAYDIVLRLARNLLEHGATVHIIIQDPKDGIRDAKYLNNSKKETCMGREIPLNQVKRLKQRCDVINDLNYKAKEKYKRAIFVHLDSRSKKQQLDVFFYHQNDAGNKKKSKQMAETMVKTFREQYNKHQPGRGFSGTVSTRQLYVLTHTNPVSTFVELANMQNVNDQKRYVSENNRQALANWLCMGYIKDYQQSK
jgi:N-acetylmuramoyl-L-alanine amidase